MALVFECIQTEGIAALSYLIGDDSAAPIHDADTFKFGSPLVTVGHRPGHTSAHAAYLAVTLLSPLLVLERYTAR